MSPPDANKINDFPYYVGQRIFNRQRKWFATSLAYFLTAAGCSADAPRSPVQCLWAHDGGAMAGELWAYSAPSQHPFAPWIVRASLCRPWSGRISTAALKRIGLTAPSHAPERWKLEVTILPTELDVAFVAWLCEWIACKGDASKSVPTAPHGIICDRTYDYVWSPAAGRAYDGYRRRLNETKQRAATARAERLARSAVG